MSHDCNLSAADFDLSVANTSVSMVLSTRNCMVRGIFIVIFSGLSSLF